MVALLHRRALLLIQLTLMIAVAAVLGVVAWIGYTLATTPLPKPIEEIEKEIRHERDIRERRASGGRKAGKLVLERLDA
jgi:predicted DNA-binding transcriptional regulator